MSNNLPVQITSFIGRERELSELTRLLTTTRLLTLTGAGGTGKTRLALHVATEVLEGFTDGVWFVELASLADPSLVPITIATVLGVREEPGRSLVATLQDWLREKTLLLILDNCEHLLEACAQFAEAVLRGSRETRILATSREALAIAGETVYRVPSLESPTAAQASQLPFAQIANYAAIQLFVARAAQTLTTFSLNPTNAPAVVQVCAMLDGIPLAIELAAARVSVLRVDQIAERLDDRFRLLAGGSRTAMPRQQTLRGAIDWSYSLLTEPERVLFRRLAVFAGGWTLAAAEAVCSGEGIDSIDVLGLMTRLVDKSLVTVDQAGPETRYRMLETVRQYAFDRLSESGEGPRLRDRHLEFWVRLAEEFSLENAESRTSWWLCRFETEIDNIRHAFEWSLSSHKAISGMRLATALNHYWVQRRPVEGINFQRQVIAQPEAMERGLVRVKALAGLGLAEFYHGDPVSAQQSYEAALTIAREIADEQTISWLLRYLGDTAIARKDFVSARLLLTEALAIFRKVDSPWIGHTLGSLGDLALRENRLEEAKALYEEDFAILTLIGQKSGPARAQRRLGQIAVQRGEFEQASALIQKSLTRELEVQDKRGVAANVAALAAMLAAQGRVLDAIRLCGEVDALLESIHSRLTPLDNELNERTLKALRDQVDHTTFDAAWTEGRAMTMEQAIADVFRTEPPHEPASSPVRGPDDLSTREREVLSLVAAGMSDAQVAEKLVLSARTINSHLTTIYRKLGVNSRAAATRYALDHKLV